MSTNLRTVFVILGMHRSGTSALTRLINLCWKAELPLNLMRPGPDNERGFWESARLALLNDELLQTFGLAWYSIKELPRGWADTAQARRLSLELEFSFREEFGVAPRCVFKDPRMCRLLPVWRSIFRTLRMQVHYILVVRHPLEVSASLQSRDASQLASSLREIGGMTEQHALLLWLRHFLDAERDTRGQNRSFVAYDQLLGDWRTTVSKISADLGLPRPAVSEATRRKIQDFLSPALRHHHVASNMACGNLPDLDACFGLAQNAASGGQPDLDQIDNIRRSFGDVLASKPEPLPPTLAHVSGEPVAETRKLRCKRPHGDLV